MLHQHQVWYGNDACLFKILILSIMTDLTDQKCPIVNMTEFVVTSILAAKYLIEFIVLVSRAA